MPLQLSLLGGFECRSGSGDVLTFPTSKVRALFAYLATNSEQGHRRDKLADFLWGDDTAGEGRANLRKALSRLRQSLPGDARDCLAVDRDQLAVRPGALEVDVGLFLRLAADGTPETLERAAGLYRGAFLEGFADCGEAFEEWLLAERRRLDETLHEILRRLLDHYVVTGAIDRGIQVALRLIALDPLQESVHRALIRLYMYQDRVGAALDQYRRCRDVLERELGVPPDAETERLRAELSKLLPDGEAGQDTPLREADDLPERTTVLRSAARERARRRAELADRPSIAVLCFAGADVDGCGHLGGGHGGRHRDRARPVSRARRDRAEVGLGLLRCRRAAGSRGEPSSARRTCWKAPSGGRVGASGSPCGWSRPTPPVSSGPSATIAP